MTKVWPALWPPWKRTTMSACSDNQSTILPLPSSPHWDPTTTTLAIRIPSLRSPRTLEAGCHRPGPPSDKGSLCGRQAKVQGWRGTQRTQQRLDLTSFSEMQGLGLLHLRQRTHLGEHVLGQVAVDLDQRHRIAAWRVASDVERGNVDARFTEGR